METIINQEYLTHLGAGTIRDTFVRKLPFEHAVFPDFFTSAFLEKVKLHAATIALEASPSVGAAGGADLGWGAYSDQDTLRSIFGSSFQNLMSAILGRGVCMSARSIPQYFRYEPGSRGMTVHNDANEKNQRQIVSLLQLSDGYQPGFGGELLLNEAKENGHSVATTIPPVSNTFVIFLVSDNSWHSVADMHGSWTRELVSFDWYFR